MLRYTAIYENGLEARLENVLTAVLDCDMDVPADSLALTVPFDDNIRKNARGICACKGDRLLFRGKLDTVMTIKRSSGVIMKLVARGPAAGLLDNEAEPVTYSNPSAALIERRHLAPFGITLADGDNIPLYDRLKIEKGMSHWQVARSFCRSRYGSELRITGDGKAYFQKAPSGKKTVFSDADGDVVYYDLGENVRRYRLISEIKLKFKQANTYSSSLKNTNPESSGVTRVRYLNAAADHTTLLTADKMLQNSNRGSYELSLRCKGCHTDRLGCTAAVDDSMLGMLDGLIVRGVRYTMDRAGERSIITLEKERYDVADELHNEKLTDIA